MAKILNVVYEPIFLDCSFGYRSGKRQHGALKELSNRIVCSKTNYVVEVDIRGFFDNLKHDWLIKFLKERIADPNFIRLIVRFLKAGIIEESKYAETEMGAAQGGLISPTLSNVYLHYVLDLWFEKKIKKVCTGEAHMVRYCDDFVCCFQKKDEAERFLVELRKRLGKFGLEVAENKTKIMEFGRFAESDRNRKGKGRPETFDFLGFTHICCKSKDGKFMVKKVTSQKKLKIKRMAAKKWIRENMHTKPCELIKRLNKKLIGHYAYYGISGNIGKLTQFREYVLKQLFHTLNRRSQKRSYNWEEFKQNLLKYVPIAPARIYVSREVRKCQIKST